MKESKGKSSEDFFGLSDGAEDIELSDGAAYYDDEDEYDDFESLDEPLDEEDEGGVSSGHANGRELLKAVAREAFGFLVSLAVAWVAVMFLVTYVGTLCTVDGSSMENTLHDGDRLWADKLTYRFSDPQRFDIIIFPPQYDSDSKYIKRIIGLPGETIHIDEEGNIYIDGEILEEDYGKEVIRADLRYLAAGEITLGEDEYFVLGDNRNESLDSRYEIVGTVKRSDIFGKAVFRLWPLSGFGILD
ncbi:MAG: signal peptidase I [Lachnospiraceae bacterium]|nr:signal peptidase I [Lachnospiraceae bacterium]